ncbi:MAG TPA: sigma-54 dependent transcriptional regulator [Nevskiaceae bacterium]|nr:sigma-54 dependent transcriptional regulator [Nevskiaceae bacterium]
MSESRVLVIDRDPTRLQNLAACLAFIDHTPILAETPAGLRLEGRRPQDWLAVILGELEDWSEARQFVDWLKRDRRHPPLIVLPPYHEKAIKEFELDPSACLPADYPVKYHQLNELLKRAGLLRMEQEAAMVRRAGGPGGQSAAIRRVRRLIEQVAAFDTTVLVTGESGTGKEVVARAIHDASPRRDKPFVAVNCGAIPSELLESELFGHEKGAFTGAITTRKGRFEMADGGTLFLDEIGDMSLPMQVKILRALQERTYERVGSNRSVRCDVRVIAATHRNLEEAIVKGSFREDLYYRLNVFPIETPPLRERLEDLPLLIDDLVAGLGRHGHAGIRLGADAIHALRAYHWPGNVRELSNLIERLAVLHPKSMVGVQDLPARYRSTAVEAPLAAVPELAAERPPAAPLVPSPLEDGGLLPATPVADLAVLPADGVNLKDHIESIELALIRQAMTQSNGVVAHAAKLLNTRRTTLVEKLRKYGLSRDLPGVEVAGETLEP